MRRAVSVQSGAGRGCVQLLPQRRGALLAAPHAKVEPSQLKLAEAEHGVWWRERKLQGLKRRLSFCCWSKTPSKAVSRPEVEGCGVGGQLPPGRQPAGAAEAGGASVPAQPVPAAATAARPARRAACAPGQAAAQAAAEAPSVFPPRQPTRAPSRGLSHERPVPRSPPLMWASCPVKLVSSHQNSQARKQQQTRPQFFHRDSRARAPPSLHDCPPCSPRFLLLGRGCPHLLPYMRLWSAW